MGYQKVWITDTQDNKKSPAILVTRFSFTIYLPRHPHGEALSDYEDELSGESE